MKKILASIFGLAVLAGCSSSYDYYQGGVKYTQDGSDCIYKADEEGDRFSSAISNMESNKTIVYRNTMCSALYEKDSSNLQPRRDRAVVAPVFDDAQQVKFVNPCGSCGSAFAPVLKRKYIIVPAI